MSTKNRMKEQKGLTGKQKVSGGKRAHKEKLNGNCWAEKYND